MAASAAVYPMLQDKLANEIFSILENKFLFGNTTTTNAGNGKVRILSMDAGDAILAANTLVHLQSILRAKSGNPRANVADFFDVVAGSGAGGVLAALLFTRGKDGAPIMTAEQSLKFLMDNQRSLRQCSPGLLGRRSKAGKLLKKVLGDTTLKESTLKGVLIPCYDLRSGAALLFSRADALEMDGCDFRMSTVCEATLAGDNCCGVQLKSRDGSRKIMAVGGRVGMSNPTAAAITHVLNNKQEFPLCNSLQDLSVLSLAAVTTTTTTTNQAYVAAHGAADMVDQAVSMAFGEARSSNYVRVQGNIGRRNRDDEDKRSCRMMMILRLAEEILLREKNVESVLFKGKKVGELTNMERVEIFGGEMIKEEERRKKAILPTVQLKNSSNTTNTNTNTNTNSNSPRSSSATTLSTLSSN